MYSQLDPVISGLERLLSGQEKIIGILTDIKDILTSRKEGSQTAPQVEETNEEAEAYVNPLYEEGVVEVGELVDAQIAEVNERKKANELFAQAAAAEEQVRQARAAEAEAKEREKAEAHSAQKAAAEAQDAAAVAAKALEEAEAAMARAEAARREIETRAPWTETEEVWLITLRMAFKKKFSSEGGAHVAMEMSSQGLHRDSKSCGVRWERLTRRYNSALQKPSGRVWDLLRSYLEGPSTS